MSAGPNVRLSQRAIPLSVALLALLLLQPFLVAASGSARLPPASQVPAKDLGLGETADQPYSSSLRPGYYVDYTVRSYGLGITLEFQVQATSPVEIMVLNVSGLAALQSSAKYTPLYSRASANVVGSVELPTKGTYYLVVYNNMSSGIVEYSAEYDTVPVDVQNAHSGPPAPAGIADYGVVNESGYLVPYSVAANGVTGEATIYGLAAHNASVVSGASPFGAGLQLNVVLRVNTTSGSYVYWLQNVMGMYTNNNTAYFDDNIWNFTTSHSSMDYSHVSGQGQTYQFGNAYYYGAATPVFPYVLPFSIGVPISVSHSGYSATVSFASEYSAGGQLTGASTVYDTATITEDQQVTSAEILVSGYRQTPSGHYFDAEFVYGGDCCGSVTTYTQMNSTLSFTYSLVTGGVAPPRSLFGFGSDTAEGAYNLRTELSLGKMWVALGESDFSTDYVLSASPQLPLTLSYAVSDGSSMGQPPVLTYISGGRAVSATLSLVPSTFMVDTGTRWSVTYVVHPAGGGGEERWITASGANGTATAALSRVLVFFHQFVATASASAIGGGWPVPPSLQGQAEGKGVTLALGVAPVQLWLDAGTTWTTTNPVGGPTQTSRWDAGSGASGTVVGPSTIAPAYTHQYLVSIESVFVGGGNPGGVSFNYSQVGALNEGLVPAGGVSVWIDAGGTLIIGSTSQGSGLTERWYSNDMLTSVVTSAENVTATFHHQYHVTVGTDPATAPPPLPASGWSDAGSLLTLSSPQDPSWRLVGWVGEGTGAYTGGANSTVLTVSAPIVETASFYPRLDIVASGAGSVEYSFGTTKGTVSSGSTTTLFVPPGTQVTLTALPSVFQALSGWAGSSGASGDTITVSPVSPVRVTASFSPNIVELGGVAALAVVVVAVVAVALRRRRRA